MSMIRFKEILKESYILNESVVQSSYEDQLKSLYDDDSIEAKELKSFIEGNNTEKVKVDPDMRAVLPSFRFKRISSKNTFQKYPDIVFTYNFLIPYFTQMNSKSINLASIKHLRAFRIDSQMMLYRFQELKYNDPMKKKLDSIDIGNEKINKSELKIVTPHIDMCGFTRSASTAQKAIIGSGMFGEREGYIYKKNLQPILDVQKYSEMIISSFNNALGKIPSSLKSVQTYGTYEDEILAEQLEVELDVTKDIQLFAVKGRWFSPSEIIKETSEKSELETESVMLLVNYIDNLAYNGRSVVWKTKKMRTQKVQIDRIHWWFIEKKHTDEYAAVGGRTGFDFRATLEKKNLEWKEDPMIKKEYGINVYIVLWT